MAFDPVCNIVIDEKETNPSHEYKGIIYYFHSDKCKEEFKKEPENYLEKYEIFEEY